MLTKTHKKRNKHTHTQTRYQTILHPLRIAFQVLPARWIWPSAWQQSLNKNHEAAPVSRMGPMGLVPGMFQACPLLSCCWAQCARLSSNNKGFVSAGAVGNRTKTCWYKLNIFERLDWEVNYPNIPLAQMNRNDWLPHGLGFGNFSVTNDQH